MFSYSQILSLTIALSTLLVPQVVTASDSPRPDAPLWTILVVREEFGIFESIRIESKGDLYFCQFEAGRLLGEKFLAIQKGEPEQKLFNALVNELQVLNKGAEGIQSGAIPDNPLVISPRDGPIWNPIYIEWLPDGVVVQQIGSNPKIASFLQLLIEETKKNGHKAANDSGIIIWLANDVSTRLPPQRFVIQNPKAGQLLKYTGRFLPIPYPPELLLDPTGMESMSHIQTAGLDFVVWQLKNEIKNENTQ